MSTDILYVKLGPVLHKLLKLEAIKQERSMSVIVRKLIIDGLSKKKAK